MLIWRFLLKEPSCSEIYLTLGSVGSVSRSQVETVGFLAKNKDIVSMTWQHVAPEHKWRLAGPETRKLQQAELFHIELPRPRRSKILWRFFGQCAYDKHHIPTVDISEYFLTSSAQFFWHSKMNHVFFTHFLLYHFFNLYRRSQWSNIPSVCKLICKYTPSNRVITFIIKLANTIGHSKIISMMSFMI